MKFKFLMLNIIAVVQLLSMNKAEQEMSSLSLQLGIYGANLELIEKTLKNPLNLNIIYISEDLSPLMIAATKVKSIPITTLLLHKGANILFQNSERKDVMDLVMEIVKGPQASDADMQILGCIFPYYFNAMKFKVAFDEEMRRKKT